MTEEAPLIKLVYEVQNIGIVAGRLMKCRSKLSGEKNEEEDQLEEVSSEK